MYIDLEIETEPGMDCETLFNEIANEVCRQESIPNTKDCPEVTVILTDNEGIRDLNNKYRGIDSPTDVLSFPMHDPGTIDYEAEEVLLGDIVISVPKMEEQAVEYGHSNRREMSFLFVHGLLHLLGYDHIDDDERAFMEAKQDEILLALDIKR